MTLCASHRPTPVRRGHKLGTAALILALHAGLLGLLGTLTAPRNASPTDPKGRLLTTVMVQLADALPQSTPPKPVKPHEPAKKLRAAAFTSPNLGSPGAPVAGAETLTATPAPTAPSLSTSSPGIGNAQAPTQALRLGQSTLRQAARDADTHSVRGLALQSGKIDALETATPHPIALMAAEASEPRCPPAIRMRESVGPQGYALTPDRSGDCERERKAKVRARALAH